MLTPLISPGGTNKSSKGQGSNLLRVDASLNIGCGTLSWHIEDGTPKPNPKTPTKGKENKRPPKKKPKQ